MAFLRVNLQNLQSSLWVANIDGSDAQQLWSDEVFSSVAGVRFSPDGQWLVFAASGPPQRPLPTGYLPAPQSSMASNIEQCAVSLLWVCVVSRASANGAPWELWLVSTDGKVFRQLTHLSLDSPWLAFSKDGRRIAFIGLNGLFEYDRQTTRVNQLSDAGGHGVIDWFQD